MSGSVYWYADAATREVVESGRDAVLLLGGYQGYANFGDVLQLKGAIRFHREKSGLEPVVICDLAALTQRAEIEQIRAWFGVKALLFWSFSPMKADELRLAPLGDVKRIAHLHVYGGGFFNRFWGAGMIALAEAAHERFGVGHYTLSGQQVAEDFVPALREHLSRCPAALVGGRDAESVRALGHCGVTVEDSFDDSREILGEMVTAFGRDHGDPPDLLLHLNVSPYTRYAPGEDGLDRCAKNLNMLREHVRQAAGTRPLRVTLLSSYADRRIERVMDTLSVVQQLEERFPFCDYRVVDLAGLALRWPEATPPAIDLRASVAMSCSYHTALLCGLMGVPCFLLAENDYYSQKLRGLGFTEQSLGAFLQQRPAVDFSERLAARTRWLGKLEAAYRKVSPRKSAPTVSAPASDTEPAAWKPKPGLIELVHRVHRVEQELESAQVSLAPLREEHARLLEEHRALSEEAARLSKGWAEQKAFIEELEQVRDKLWNEARGLKTSLEAARDECGELKARVERLEQFEQSLNRLEQQRLYRLLRWAGLLKPGPAEPSGERT